jgi:hypothetical protein
LQNPHNLRDRSTLRFGIVANVPTSARIIIADLDVDWVSKLQRSVDTAVRVDACTDFTSARTRLLRHAPEFLVTNVRLGADNGLHLVHLAPTSTRSIVYMQPEDPFLLREAQKLGAFVESPQRLLFSLRAYLNAALPLRDRRDPVCVDRRSIPRGGRRAADVRVVA